MYALWTVVLFAGALVWLGPTFFMVGGVHHATRTISRVTELQTARPDFQPSRKDYEAACADAQAVWEANYSGKKSVFFLAAAIVITGFIGLAWTDRLSRMVAKSSSLSLSQLPGPNSERMPKRVAGSD